MIKGNLEEEIRYLRGILGNLPIVYDLLDLELNCLDANDACLKAFNCNDKSEYIARYHETFPQYQPCGTASAEKAAMYVKEALETGCSTFFWMHIDFDKNEIPGDVTLVRTELADNIFLIAFVRDMRREIAVQAELLSAQKTVQMIFDASPVMMESWDENFDMRDANEATAKFFGFSSKDEYVKEKGYMEIIPCIQKNGEDSFAYLRNNLKIAFEKAYNRFEFICRKPNGENVILDIEAVRLEIAGKSTVVTYATDLTPIIESIRRAEQAEMLCVTDTLTELYNRRKFDDCMSYEWKRSARNSSPLSLLFVDIDRFKRYNDTYGHHQGDVALKVAAEVISSNLNRSSDIVARWGGEEFAVILAETDSDGAENVANNIRSAIERQEIELADTGGTSSITVSIGVNTIVPTQHNCMEQFLVRADEALYRAKENGRNRVEHAFRAANP